MFLDHHFKRSLLGNIVGPCISVNQTFVFQFSKTASSRKQIVRFWKYRILVGRSVHGVQFVLKGHLYCGDGGDTGQGVSAIIPWKLPSYYSSFIPGQGREGGGRGVS